MKKYKTHELEKCYSIAPLQFKNKKHILVAAEKINKCLMFSADGELEDTIWEEPGGTMSMVQVPNTDGQFLATHKFYSPNDSKLAKIVVVTPQVDGTWAVETLIDLPHVHRFDIIERNGTHYIVAATLCSGRDFKDDWSYKGKVYACELPTDLSIYNENNQLEMVVIKDELLKNHGYFRGTENGYEYSVVGTEDGIFKFVPPAVKGGEFEVIKLLNSPASDMTLCDFDDDGELEMVVYSPFHGAKMDVYKLIDGEYQAVYHHEEEMPFTHAIWSGDILGENAAILGHREGSRQLIKLSFADGKYKTDIIDDGVGPANALYYTDGEISNIVSANRETNEIAFYKVSK